ncbi:MAG TPA: DUF4035 domain-containing protein [Candidatus Paceibacterota bacterium]
MPASEFVEWKAYFSIYPFTQDREDARTAALVCAVVNSVGYMLARGKALKKPASASEFMPKYLDEQKKERAKDPKQRDQYSAFRKKLRDINPKAVNESRNPGTSS